MSRVIIKSIYYYSHLIYVYVVGRVLGSVREGFQVDFYNDHDLLYGIKAVFLMTANGIIELYETMGVFVFLIMAGQVMFALYNISHSEYREITLKYIFIHRRLYVVLFIIMAVVLLI